MKTWQQCCDYFNVTPDRGLSSDQVKKNTAKYGLNGKYNQQSKCYIYHESHIFLTNYIS